MKYDRSCTEAAVERRIVFLRHVTVLMHTTAVRVQNYHICFSALYKSAHLRYNVILPSNYLHLSYHYITDHANTASNQRLLGILNSSQWSVAVSVCYCIGLQQLYFWEVPPSLQAYQVI